MSASIDKLKNDLTRRQMFGIKLGLDQTEELFRRSKAPFSLRYLHIAGTNGKGSCGALLEAALRGVGFHTGFYTSPHLVEMRERFRLDGRAATMEELGQLGNRVRRASEEMAQHGAAPTYFEFTTALAALLFGAHKVDFAVWETGMGGRFDATSVVDPELALITNIALDHQQYLGDTIEKIAFEKAGIIRAERPVFTGLMPESALAVIRRRAEECAAPLCEADDAPITDLTFGHDERGLYQEFRHRDRQIRLHLPGAMQRRNFRAVYPVLAYLANRYHFDLDRALDALATTRWPGRCQELTDRLLIDGGHNPDGAAALAEALQEVCPGEKFTVIFGGFKDKDVSQNLKLLAAVAKEFIFTPLADERPSRSPEELQSMLTAVAPEIPAQPAANAADALCRAEAGQGRILAAGSLYLVGEILKARAPEAALDLI